MPYQELTDIDVCPTSAKLNVLAFLLDLTDTIFITNVDACPASAKCHNAIVLFNLVDAIFITYVLLLFLCTQSVL
jgi:hypothetical protein